MTLAELFSILVDRQTFPAPQVKSIRTAVRYLAKALGAPDPEHCPLPPEHLTLETWMAAIEAHFVLLERQGQPRSLISARNIRSNLRRIFRAVQAQSLLSVPSQPRVITRGSRQAFEAHQLATAPYRNSYHATGSPRTYGLQPRDWPEAIVQGWKTYLAACNPDIRETTHTKHATVLSLYLGYILRYVGRPPTWDDCFSKPLLREFMLWHRKRLGKSITGVGRDMVIVAALLAKVLGRDDARALADWRNTLQAPDKVHNKEEHWIPLAELDAIAEGCLRDASIPSACPRGTKHPGSKRASLFQKGLILKIMLNVPLRQRNIREMRQPDNLYQERRDGHWHLRYKGAELKVGVRQGRGSNTYRIDLSEKTVGVVPVLEAFLNDWRPKLPGAATSPYVFLTQYGNPYSQHSLYEELRTLVGMRSGCDLRFFPHLIRSIWTTQSINAGVPVTVTATMLGDRPHTVLQSYNEMNEELHQSEALKFMHKALGCTEHTT